MINSRMKTYKVDVYDDGTKHWYLNDKHLTEAEFNARTKPTPSCEGKVVEVDGVKYKLTKV